MKNQRTTADWPPLNPVPGPLAEHVEDVLAGTGLSADELLAAASQADDLQPSATGAPGRAADPETVQALRAGWASARPRDLAGTALSARADNRTTPRMSNQEAQG